MNQLLRAMFVPVLFGFFATASAQEYTLTVEEHATDIVEGLTYGCTSTPMRMISFRPFTEVTTPLSITTSTGSLEQWIQWNYGNQSIPFFHFSRISADSWVTIGLTARDGDGVAVST